MKNNFIILITAYNDEKWVEYNIASILNQTYDNYKVLFYDDASTDNTYKIVKEIVKNNNKFIVTTREKNMQALFSYEECINQIKDDEILICMSADDWFYDDDVLDKLNKYYNKHNVWMTYGKFVTWDGINTELPSPQNSHYPDLVHEYSLYRKDHWRASHLRTFKGSLLRKVDLSEFKSDISNSYFDHAADLVLTYPCLEMCGKDRIGVLDFYSYAYNTTPEVKERTVNRESDKNNHKFELEIRNRKVYQRLKNLNDTPKKLPQVNVYGDNKERHTIPTHFSYVYNLNEGEYDLSFLQDNSIIDYLDKKISINNLKPIVAFIAEPPHLFNQKEVLKRVLENHDKFDTILGWEESLHNLSNYKFCPLVEISQWNLLPEKLNPNIFQIYNKTKLTSFIASNKNICPDHQFRLDCVNEVSVQNLKVDIFGRGINPISSKLEGLKDYHYSVAMENLKTPFYFTEKIIDCFLSGTIPIYYGCPNIEKFFNIKGIITFHTKKELIDIINNITPQFYLDNLDAVQENYNIAKNIWIDNDRFFNKYLKELI